MDIGHNSGGSYNIRDSISVILTKHKIRIRHLARVMKWVLNSVMHKKFYLVFTVTNKSGFIKYLAEYKICSSMTSIVLTSSESISTLREKQYESIFTQKGVIFQKRMKKYLLNFFFSLKTLSIWYFRCISFETGQ